MYFGSNKRSEWRAVYKYTPSPYFSDPVICRHSIRRWSNKNLIKLAIPFSLFYVRVATDIFSKLSLYFCRYPTRRQSIKMDPTVETKPWLTFLDKEASNTSAQDFVPDVANILKNYLISKTENNNALETAKKIDSYSVPSPYMHLSSVYWMIFDTAAVIPYNDATQEKLLNLLIEMLRLPRRKFETQAGEVSYCSHAYLLDIANPLIDRRRTSYLLWRILQYLQRKLECETW